MSMLKTPLDEEYDVSLRADIKIDTSVVVMSTSQTAFPVSQMETEVLIVTMAASIPSDCILEY